MLHIGVVDQRQSSAIMQPKTEHFTELEWHGAARVGSNVVLVQGATNESRSRVRTKTVQPGPGSMRLGSCAR